MFSLIACIGKNRELGRGGELIFRIKEDMEFFRKTTMGHKVVMGRKTWESLPSRLLGRENIVISHRDFAGPDRIIHEIGTFVSQNTDTDEEIFVIGGGAVYEEFLPDAQNLYLTEVDAEAPDADTFFPEFDRAEYTRNVLKEGENYKIIKYIKKGLNEGHRI